MLKPLQLRFLLLIALFLGGGNLFAQSNHEIFGQNRIQYKKFDWKYFDTKHFRVYFYDKTGRGLGRYVAEEAEKSVGIIEAKMAGNFPDRFNIVLYNSFDDYRQTNVGLKDESAIAQITVSGTWNLTGDKLVVYHTGQHNDLKHQIQAGMAQVVMEYGLYGESFKRVARTTFLQDLPPFLLKGYISYVVDGWTAATNSEWKRVLDANPDEKFHKLTEEYPELAGKAFWKFVSDMYGKETMRNLMSALEKKTNINIICPQLLGAKVHKIYDSVLTYFKSSYDIDFMKQDLPDSSIGLISVKLPKDETIIRNVMVSPAGTDIAYTSWKNGQYSIYTQKTRGEKTLSILLQGGQRDPSDEIDPNYPLMTWSAAGNKLAILYRSKRKTCLRIYNTYKGRIENYVIPPNRFDRVLGMSFMQDDDKMVFSAIRKSQTDLYTFTIKGSKLTNITDDIWDDVNPVFVSGGARKGILFLSNRPKPNMDVPLGINELPTGNMNVFFYNTTTQRKELLQCTDIKKGKVSQPIQYGADNFAYLYDSNGINNKYVVVFGRDHKNMDSAYSLPVTNYNTSIVSHQFNPAVNEVADVIQLKDDYLVFFHGLQMPTDSAQPKHLEPTTLSYEKPDTLSPPVTETRHRTKRVLGLGHKATATSNTKINIGGNNEFQSEFTDNTRKDEPVKTAPPPPSPAPVTKSTAQEENNEADSSTLKVINDSAYVKMKPTNYRRSFKSENLNVKLDNSILFSQYQSFSNTGGQYQNPALGALTTFNITELMEDYKVTLGFNIPLDFSSSSYFLEYKNTKRRLDWDLLVFRTLSKNYYKFTYSDGIQLFDYIELVKNVATMGQLGLSYPFDRIRSLKLSTAIRQDRMIIKSSDTFSLSYDLPNTNQYWSLSRLEYVFDNSVPLGTNLRKGTRYKVYSEYMNQVNSNQSCYNYGLDYRTYQPVYRNAIIAGRLAYAHSDGTAMVQYQLGGVDNWYSPQAASTPQPEGNFGFISLATSMRGYLQASQKGNNFAVATIEGRAPLSSFLNRPIRSQYLRDLQAVIFCDAGSAWSGFTPNANSNSATYQFITGTSNSAMLVQAKVPNTGGLEVGYGFGLRTNIAGYFIRFDMAWNPESTKPISYVALGYDF